MNLSAEGVDDPGASSHTTELGGVERRTLLALEAAALDEVERAKPSRLGASSAWPARAVSVLGQHDVHCAEVWSLQHDRLLRLRSQPVKALRVRADADEMLIEWGRSLGVDLCRPPRGYALPEASQAAGSTDLDCRHLFVVTQDIARNLDRSGLVERLAAIVGAYVRIGSRTHADLPGATYVATTRRTHCVILGLACGRGWSYGAVQDDCIDQTDLVLQLSARRGLRWRNQASFARLAQ